MAIFPLLFYGSEPSVSNGILSQLPSSHLSIHRVPAKLFYGVMLHGKSFLPATALFLIELSLTRFPYSSTDRISGRTLPLFHLVCFADIVYPTLSFTGSFSRTLPSLHACLAVRQGSGNLNQLHYSSTGYLCHHAALAAAF